MNDIALPRTKQDAVIHFGETTLNPHVLVSPARVQHVVGLGIAHDAVTAVKQAPVVTMGQGLRESAGTIG